MSTSRGPSDVAASSAAFVLLLAFYIVLGVVLRSAVLNWVVGPLFPMMFLYAVPHLVSALRRGSER